MREESDPLAFDFDLSEVLEMREIENTFHPQEEKAEEEDTDEDQGDPFVANLAQSKLRAAAVSGLYDTLIAAGTISSSKTYGIIAILIDLCLEYSETLVLVIRASWGDLLDKTIPDFADILTAFPNEFYHWPNRLTCLFWNGSMIRFRPAREQKDPKFSWLKGNKPDLLFIDEHDGVSKEFLSMAQSRVGVERRRRRPLAPKCLPMAFFACNPNIGHPKDDYSLHIHNPAALTAQRKYFQLFTINDNREFIGDKKLEQWKRTMTPPMYKCFVEGSWDAMSEREQLITFDHMDACKGIHQPPEGQKWEYYLGVDPAGYGPDKCPFLILHGPNIYKLDFFGETRTNDIVDHTKKLMAEFNISAGHVTIDTVGLGAGVVDYLHSEGIFVNRFNGAEMADDSAFYQTDPTDPTSKLEMDNFNFTFKNKRAQSFWETMQMLRDGKIGGFNPEVLGWHSDINLYEVLRQDLASIHYKFAAGTKAIQIESKDDIKKRLHRSPDFADVLVYAIWSYLVDSKRPSMEIITF